MISVPERLQAVDSVIYDYTGVCPFDGLLMYQWTAEDGSPQTYEVTETEVNELIALGWWQEVPTPSAGDEREGATTK